MRRQVVVGHRRQIVPNGVVVPRQRVEGGWTAACSCGAWTEIVPTYSEAKQAYAAHLAVTSSEDNWRCRDCGEWKPTARRSKRPDSGRICASCATAHVRRWAAANPSRWERQRRESHLRRKFGIGIEDYERMLAEQDGKCAICQGDPEDARGFRPHVDHDHETGAVRGVLCAGCNVGLGSFKDNVALLLAAADYLLRSAATTVPRETAGCRD